MKIKVNGKERIIDKESLFLRELLKIANVENPETVSVQINGAFVGKESFDSTAVKDGDNVDFLYFMGGGI